MTAAVHVRHANAEDVPEIARIMNQAIRETTAVWHEDSKSTEEVVQWLGAKQHDGWPVLVARVGDQTVGYGTFGPFRPFAGYRYTVEHSVYIAPEHQGQGFGRLLLTALIERATETARHVMVGGIDADNHASLRLHKSLGFTEVARMPEVGWKFGGWRCLVFMQKTLPAQPVQSP